MTDIAVVIPCFNLGRTVVEAVDSVCAQTKPAAEIVLVDDGSTDLYTRQTLASLSRPSLRVVRAEHRGASRTRNLGAGLTSSPYLLFLDADDLLDSTYLQRTGASLDADPNLDFVSTAMRGFGEAHYIWTPPPPELLAAFTRGTIPITALLRRKVWDTVGGFDEGLRASMDLDFWISTFERGFRGWVIDEPLLLRRVRADSLHHSTVGEGAYRGVLETILRKHQATVDQLGPELLIAKETFVSEQLRDRARLDAESAALHSELGHLNERIAELKQQLRNRGEATLDLQQLTRLEPVSPVWGTDRGRPVDRYYIEAFLAEHHSDIRGRVLEIKDRVYCDRFGSSDVTAIDILDVVADNPRATIVADLTRADSIATESFDCFILTQTLHIIYDIRAALSHVHRILAPGGVVLATLPAVSRINYEDGGLDGGDYWRFTETSLRRLFGELFGSAHVDIRPAGNLKACISFLYGLATDELLTAELDQPERACPLVFCVRAVKSEEPRLDAAIPDKPARRTAPAVAAAILMYHRVTEVGPDPHRLCVGPHEFRLHMEYLAGHHTILPLEQMAYALRDGDVLQDSVALTFDDGMLDALEIASPILVELGLPATFFVNSDRLDEEHEPWWDALGRIFLDSTLALPPTLVIDLDGKEHSFLTGSPAERSAAYAAIQRGLIRAGLLEREAAMARIAEWSGLELPARGTHRQLLSREIRILASRPGHTIGSHSVHHLFLPLQERQHLEREIRMSKERLEDVLQKPINLFSYPYGGHVGDTMDIVRAAGFRAAVTTVSKRVSKLTDPFAMPRIDVKGDGVGTLVKVLQDTLSQP